MSGSRMNRRAVQKRVAIVYVRRIGKTWEQYRGEVYVHMSCIAVGGRVFGEYGYATANIRRLTGLRQ